MRGILENTVLVFLDLLVLQSLLVLVAGRRYRSVIPNAQPSVPRADPDWNEGFPKSINSVDDLENNPLTNSIDFFWSTQTVAQGDTAVLHCSFDAIFSQLRNGNIDWVKEDGEKGATLIATGKKAVLSSRRYRVYRPHNSALSVLIIRRAKKRDAGIFRCNLSGSSTRHKYLILNVTESKIEAQTSPARLKARIGKDITLWCNATGYPRPVVYWTREDSNRKLPDGSYQFWGNGLYVTKATEADTGIYACYLDNFVQPVVSYKFSLVVEDRPWHLDGFKMRFDSSQWYNYDSRDPKPVQGKSFLLMCETRGMPKPLPKIRWFKDSRQIRNNRHFYIIEDRPEWRTGYTSSTLVIMKFVPRHMANYTCVASNVFRTKTREFIVHGYEPYVKGSRKGESGVINTIPKVDDDGEETDGEDDEEEDSLEDNGRIGTKDASRVRLAARKKTGIVFVRKDKTTGPTDDEDYDATSGSGSGFGQDDTEEEEEEKLQSELTTSKNDNPTETPTEKSKPQEVTTDSIRHEPQELSQKDKNNKQHKSRTNKKAGKRQDKKGAADAPTVVPREMIPTKVKFLSEENKKPWI